MFDLADRLAIALVATRREDREDRLQPGAGLGRKRGLGIGHGLDVLCMKVMIY